MVWLCVKWTYIVHYICNIGISKTRNDFSVQVRSFLLPLSLKVLRHKEWEAQSFYPGFFICPPPNTCGTYHKGLREQAKVNRLVRCLVSTLLTFFHFPKFSARFRCVTSFALASHRFPSRASVTFLSDTSALRVRVNTCVMLHLSNPCTEPKSCLNPNTWNEIPRPLYYIQIKQENGLK